MTETALAARLHRDLGALGTDAGWSATPGADQDEGNYTDPIADAKEYVGVDGDLADATAAQLKAVRRAALGYCFDRLIVHYAQAIDTSGDGQSQAFSQIGLAIERARVAMLGRAAIGANLRGYRKPDFSLACGNAPEPTDE